MATAPISLEQLKNASLDADDLDVVVNGDETASTVNRAGNTLPSIQKMFYDLLVAYAAADAHADRAETAAAAAAAAGNLWGTISDGLANTAPNGYFSVVSTVPGESSIVYQKVDGAAVEITRTPDPTVVRQLLSIIRRGNQPADDILNVSNPDGQPRFRVRAGKFEVAKMSIDVEDSFDGVVLRDREGFWRAVLPAGVSVQNQDLQTRDALNQSAAIKAQDAINTQAERFVYKYNIVLSYGQSFVAGTEAYPALSSVPYYPNDLFMFGSSVRPNSLTSANWIPVGTAAPSPLKAVTQSNATGNPVLTPEQTAALAPGSDNNGETFDVSGMNMWRKQWLQWHSLASDPSRRVIVVNCAVGGKSVEDLSKGGPANYYNRVLDACQAIKTWVAANDAGASVGLVSILYDQGQNNSTGFGTRDKTTFKNLTRQLFVDIRNDVAVTMFGQSAPPAVFFFQTGSSYVQTVNDMSIQMAQVELANENPNFVLVGPTYGVTNKGNGHRDSNGSRWNGNQLGKVLHRVIDRGQAWKPLQPLKATYTGSTVLIDMLVPAAPIQFRPYYIGSTATMAEAMGFRAEDDDGAISCSVDIAADTIVRVTLGRSPVGELVIYYADQLPGAGGGNLFDSDATQALDTYSYTAGTGQYPESNIPALVNRPYPLNNACVAFRIVATKS